MLKKSSKRARAISAKHATHSDQASRTALRVFNLEVTRPCPLAPCDTRSVYRITISQAFRGGVLAVVRVRRTLTLAAGGPRLTEPKTPRSRRSIRLTTSAVGALERHRARQQNEHAARGDGWSDQGFVFCTRRGTPIRRDNLHAKHWKPLLRRAGLPDVRFHDLRHTCATLLLTKGVHPKIVSEMLGHSSVSITLDIYSHVIPGMQEVAATIMEDALGNTQQRSPRRPGWCTNSTTPTLQSSPTVRPSSWCIPP